MDKSIDCNSTELNLYINNCYICLEECNEIFGCCNDLNTLKYKTL